MRKILRDVWIKYWRHGRAHLYARGRRRTLCGHGVKNAGPYSVVSPGYDPCGLCERIEMRKIVAEGEAVLEAKEVR